jgi:cytochrome c oxidase cbb3-type subunit 3
MQIERDTPSGYTTTGHEWNGIKELNTPVPRIVWFFIALTHVWALGYWILMPAFPLGTTFTKGLLGADDRRGVMNAVQQAKAARAVWVEQVERKSYEEIAADRLLMTSVREGGRSLFGDNCAPCHGMNARGTPGFPDLTRSSLWGHTPDVLAETIRVGINSPHKESRVAMMPALGRDLVLKGDDIANVVVYVLSLGGAPAAKPGVNLPARDLEAGKAVYVANCAACHGPEGKGKIDVGAPDLTDSYWTHGSDAASMHGIVWGGLRGEMPGWEGRLSPVERKILALYLADLRRKQP